MALQESALVVKPYKRLLRKLSRKKTQRRFVKLGLLGGNFLLLAGVALFIIQNPHQSSAATPLVLSSSPANQPAAANPLDEVSSANIAETVARLGSLPETTAVTNQADSQTTELAMAPTTNSVVEKPQVVATSFASNKDIKSYTAVAGDSVTSIAARFGITSDSIRWSNNISGDAVSPGQHLLIPPVSGIIYTVQAGDTPTSLAQKYSADQNKIIAYNDAEISGLSLGERIIIPGATKGMAAASTASKLLNTSSSYGWGGSASYGSNGYDLGYCTWWVAKLRAQAGEPLPSNLGNASTWAIRAAEFGIPTGTTPRVGAAVITKTSGEGHVAYVTGVNADGSITISEMNRDGWDRQDTATMSGSGLSYVY